MNIYYAEQAEVISPNLSRLRKQLNIPVNINTTSFWSYARSAWISNMTTFRDKEIKRPGHWLGSVPTAL